MVNKIDGYLVERLLGFLVQMIVAVLYIFMSMKVTEAEKNMFVIEKREY